MRYLQLVTDLNSQLGAPPFFFQLAITGPNPRASQVVLVVKNCSAHAGDIRDVDLIPELGRSPGGGPGNPLQYSYLENSMDRGAW